MFLRTWPVPAPPRWPLPLLQPKPRGMAWLSVPTLCSSSRDVSLIYVVQVLALLNQSGGAQQLTRSVRSAMFDILMRCDDLCTGGVRSPTWVIGWDYPLHLAFTRSITPDNPTTARKTTLIDDFFGRVSRAMAAGASGPEAFTLLIRLFVTHFDRVDTGESYTKLNTFGVGNVTPSSDISRPFCILVSTRRWNERDLSSGTDMVLGMVRMAVN